MERNGFEAAGIDNFYHDSVTSVNRHQFISDNARSQNRPACV